ncbi:MAG TPA: GNAT family N-acetyltransferase [Vicinamibacterales bacterium]
MHDPEDPRGTTFTVRPANAADAAPLSQFAAAIFERTFAPQNRPEDMAAYLSANFSPPKQAAEIADPDAITLLVEAEGALIGYAHLRRGEAPGLVQGPDPFELVRFYIAREWQGRGVAHALMEKALARVAAAGGRTVWLGVWEQNPRAIAFYRKWGFADVGAHEFVLGRDVQTDRVMMRPVGEPAAQA